MQSLFLSMLIHPVVDFGLCQAQDVLFGIGRGFATANIQEVQTGRSLVQDFLITGGVAIVTVCIFLNQSSGFGIILFLADNLLHGKYLLSQNTFHIIHKFPKTSSDILFIPNNLCKPSKTKGKKL